MIHRLASFVDERQEELLTLLSRLVAARTENPPGNEHLAAKVLEDFFGPLGIPFEKWEAERGRTNIIGTVGRGRPRILIAGHLDTVPVGDGWLTDPFKLQVRGGYAYGRGTCDNKGATAAMLLAGAFLKSIEDSLGGEVWLAGVADEEKGSALGVSHLLEKGVLDVDYALVPDVPENLETIDVAEKGALFLQLTSRGKQAHGSRPEDGVNAIWNMIRLLERLRQARIPFTSHPYLGPPTVNLGRIEGGAAPNMVPATCRASVDIRFLPGTSEEQIRSMVQSLLQEAQNELEGDFEMETLTSHPATEVPESSPPVRAMIEASREVTGRPMRPGGMAGATVVKQLLVAGVTAIGCGAGEPNMPHTANERVPLDQLRDLAKILALTSLKLMAEKPASPPAG